MIRIDCPWCGRRDEAEFTYRGDATVVRPAADAPVEAFHDFVYSRANPRGWHVEWWYHSAGCRQYLKVVRHTMTHEVRAVVRATDSVEVPAE
jgi:sarcosine oxidase subunit delta